MVSIVKIFLSCAYFESVILVIGVKTSLPSSLIKNPTPLDNAELLWDGDILTRLSTR